mmetsp:Transcript_25251/g.19021  ORF Transcript_25251/g.19021 Transcript_25251/m.19021 type:complete len:186 (+) Transcript_25251:84-641(+)|eukprot:CAMPEP_0202964554 /NCGR_PEP_ID=MMETSP1396-20130829/8637_1 /ASSEMBLY_ACC=CAM_ASM_000872 /TAXON_ID= /ORGANISM="Pseudokeronopsis sp., Strain Brazil" /LENGTH=185 /DNA_ID=CAMNT_0049686741 /DNA_START=84 /DNA_END=641 /DNA_ORIENTATION=+
MSAEQKPVKLPYFHRTLSPEDVALIGDIRPKQIVDIPANDGSNHNPLEASAWNAAQTWEERNCTNWGKIKMQELFAGDCNLGSITFSNFRKLEGNASITHVRGRARFLYEWNFAIDVAFHNSNEVKLSVEVGEAINDQLDDIILSPTWKTAGLDRESQKRFLNDVHVALKRKLFEFETCFREYRP